VGKYLLRSTSLRGPANLEAWQPNAYELDEILGYMSAEALAAQHRAMTAAFKKDAPPQVVGMAALVAKNVLDRRYGRPVERRMSVGHVNVVFEGLRPELLPSGVPEDSSAVVDVGAVGDDESD
jgi:hypothetical protein